MHYKTPKTGVGILLFNDKSQLLVIQREGKRAAGKGEWAPPGGYIGYGEHFFDAAKREAKEEVGVDIQDPEIFTVTSEVVKSKEAATYHSITIWVSAKYNGAKIQPDGYEVKSFEWCEPDNLPKPIFEPFRQLLVTKEWKTKR